MEIRNLAIVFGPTLVRTTDDNMVSMVTDMSQQCRIIESILANWDYFFSDTEEVEVKEEGVDENIVTGAGNQSIMLANLQKLEDAGKVQQSPKGDVSAKDIVTSIISAANRKMLRAATKSKKESSAELEERNKSEEKTTSDNRRDSESVIHGALHIASAVPGLVGPISAGNATNSQAGTNAEGMGGRGETPDSEGGHSKQPVARQNSRGSVAGDAGGGGGVVGTGAKRRGSMSVCPSKRGSICEYSGGAVCETTPVGEVCETRLAIMKQDTSVTNGHGDGQEVGIRRGILSD